MSGLEVIPIVTGVVCAVGAAKGLLSGKKNNRDRVRRNHGEDRNHRDGKHSRHGRSRRRSSSRSSRMVSLSRDTPHSIAFKYKSRSRSQWFDSSSERSRSRTRRSRRLSLDRRSPHRRRHRSSSCNGKRRPYDDNRAGRLIVSSPYDEAQRLDFCGGRVDRIRKEFPDGNHIGDVYVCKRCKLEIVANWIPSWHRFSASDRGEVSLHKDFILRSHEARNGNFGCMICYRWMTGYKSLVCHLMNHRYADLESVIPESEWKGSEDWVS